MDVKKDVRNFRLDEDFETLRTLHLGTGTLYRDHLLTWYPLDKDSQTWGRPREVRGVDRPIFIDGKPSRFDALQGKLDNCWCVSSINAIAMNDVLMKHVVPTDQSFDHNYIGAFHFRIWKFGTWYDVVVDDFLPIWKRDGTLCFAHSRKGNIFWAALLEKAYAKFCSVINDFKLYYSYESLNAGDSAVTSMQSFSGGIIETVDTSKIPSNMTLKCFMTEAYSNNCLMCVSSNVIQDEDTAIRVGLIGWHTYAVTKIKHFEDNDPDYHGLCLIRILNPHGFDEWKGAWRDGDYGLWKQIDRRIREKLELVSRDDGEFWMEDDDVAKYFDCLCMCHLSPGQYIESHQIVHTSNWSTSTFSGEWVKHINAAGVGPRKRYKNPQYGIQLVKKNEDQTSSNVIIEMSYWSKQGREVRPNYGFGFFLYSIKTSKHIPLDLEFFRSNDPLNGQRIPDLSITGLRGYSTTMNLDPGEYCIVACTILRNVESQFFIRVFSEFRIITLYIDNKIGKSLPTEEQNLSECNEGIKRLFNDTAQGQNEIDWIGLKQILETALNPKKSYLGIISSFFQFIREVFEIFLPFRSSNDYNTSTVVFSKNECRCMISMLDDNHSGKLSFSEFSHLWNKICFWTKVYDQHRDEAKGHVTVAGLRDALGSIGYNVSKRTVISLSYVYANEQGNIFLTDFILCGVTLETVLSLYEKEFVEDQYKIAFTLEEWVKYTLIL